MKHIKTSLVPLLIFFALTITGCQAIGDIFKAGVWMGIIIVVVVIVIIFWLIGKARK